MGTAAHMHTHIHAHPPGKFFRRRRGTGWVRGQVPGARRGGGLPGPAGLARRGGAGRAEPCPGSAPSSRALRRAGGGLRPPARPSHAERTPGVGGGRAGPAPRRPL